MKKIIFFIFLISIVSRLNAQDDDSDITPVEKNNAFFMVQTGLNISKFKSTSGDLGITRDYYNVYGTSVSFMSEVETGSPYFYKQFGVKYSEMGSAFTSDRKSSVKIKYITLPLLFNFKIGTPVFKTFVGFGGYASLAFAGIHKEDGEIISEDILGWTYEKNEANDVGSPNIYHFGDAGLLFGGGFQYILPNKDAIQLAAHYSLGLIPISNAMPLVDGGESTNINEKNRCLNISVSYMFGKVRNVKSK